MLASSQIVNSYAGAALRGRRPRWDFDEENPLRDARGFDLARDLADDSQLTDEDLGLANVILTNGARLYVDHAHPEYSSPEVTNPLDAVCYDAAGQRVMAEASRRALEAIGGPLITLYKNNTDNKGASYGTHENYLMSRATPFGDIVRYLTPFFVSRQVVAGSGRVGHRPGRATSTASSSASGPTTSRSRSGSRRRSSGPSSTPATNRTPTRRSTAACT